MSEGARLILADRGSPPPREHDTMAPMESKPESDLSSLSQAQFRPLGRHRVAVCEDLIWLVSEGGLELTEIKQMMDLCFQTADQYGYTLILVDARNGGPATADSRRYQVERLKQRIVPSHSAIYGANAIVISFMALYQRAVELVTKKVTPISFHRDEAAARARLVAEREVLRRQAGQPGSSIPKT